MEATASRLVRSNQQWGEFDKSAGHLKKKNRCYRLHPGKRPVLVQRWREPLPGEPCLKVTPAARCWVRIGSITTYLTAKIVSNPPLPNWLKLRAFVPRTLPQFGQRGILEARKWVARDNLGPERTRHTAIH